MNRRRTGGPFSNPVLIGALTVLVAVVAVVLAFQANNGLPFVPRYTLHVEVRNADQLTHGAEVHMGGALVGSVASVSAARTAGGQPIAVLNLQLDKSVQPLPVDTRFTIRLKDAIGEKYLAVTLGHSRRTWRGGATVPLAQTGATVDLDQVLSMYTPRTRTGVQRTTLGFAQAVAGRGPALNAAIGQFVPLVRRLTPVMRNLAARRSGLAGFIRGLGSLTSALAPVAGTQGTLFANLDATFSAVAGVASPYLQDWITQTPPTFQSVIDNGPAIGAFASDTGRLFATLEPGFATLPHSAPELASAFAAGARNLPGTAGLDRRTVGLSKSLAAYGQDPAVTQGLARLTLTAHDLISPLQFLAPVQTRCNYVTLFLRNIASALSDNVGTGTVLRFVLVSMDDVVGGEALPASVPYTSTSRSGGTAHGPLHVDPYPNTASPGQVAECSAGNERYSASKALIGNPPGNVGLSTEQTTASGR